PAPPRAHDDDRLRLPAKPPPRRGERGKKESAKGRPSRHCPRSAAPCSPFSLARRPIDVPIAGEPSEDTSNKSAKVVLVRYQQQYRRLPDVQELFHNGRMPLDRLLPGPMPRHGS